MLNRIDLLPHLSFDVSRFLAAAHRVAPKLRVFRVSALFGEGLDTWYDWLRELCLSARAASARAAEGSAP